MFFSLTYYIFIEFFESIFDLEKQRNHQFS